jgi:hypothetical protein
LPARPCRQPFDEAVIIGRQLERQLEFLTQHMTGHHTIEALELARCDLEVTDGLVRPAGAHLRTIGPERGGGSKVAEDILFISQRPEE